MVKSEDNSIYVFGGFLSGRCTNDLWCLNIVLKQWTKVEYAKKTVPQPRANHIAQVYKSNSEENMVIFGGTTETLDRLNDLWIYHIAKNSWEEIIFKPEEIPELPSARSEHSSVIYKNSLIIFGGRTSALKELNDVVILNLQTMKWKTSSALCLHPSPDKSFSSPVKDPSPDISADSRNSGKKVVEGSFSAASQSKTQKAGSPPGNKSPSPPKEGKSPSSPSHPPSKKSHIAVKKPNRQEIESALLEMKLLSPTTSMMLNSVVMRVGEKNLEQYGQIMRRKKRISGLFSLTKQPEFENEYCVRGRIPCARSGHSADIIGQNMLIFAGDRSQVALNDIYLYDLSKL